tara:strand:- start:952 stop:1275 length:324 start_codon:yes stop_codon:yes gene_type:complete
MLNEDVRQFNLSVGKKIKTRRLELKKTQSWLAKKIGVTFQQVQKYEKGTNGTNPYNLKQIADTLKVSILYFYLDGVSTSCVMDVSRTEEPLILTKEMEIENDQSSSR